MLDQEKYRKFNQVLMRMGHDEMSKRRLLNISKTEITQDTLDEMVSLEYLIEYEKDGETYYMPTENSKEIW